LPEQAVENNITNDDSSGYSMVVDNIKRIMIICSERKRSRGLAGTLVKYLDTPRFSVLDPATRKLPGTQFDWPGIDMLIIDLSADRSRIRNWYLQNPDIGKLAPAIFLDSNATIDEAGAFYRAGAIDYMALQGLKRKRLVRSLMIVSSARKKQEQGLLQGQPRAPAKTEVLPAVAQPEAPAKTDVMPAVAHPEVPEETGMLPATTQTSRTGDTKPDFLTTGIMDILQRDAVLQASEGQVVHDKNPTAELYGQTWPFTIEDIKQGIAFFKGYDVNEYIGSGGTASVFKVVRRADGQVFAMKLYDVDSADHHGRERFMRGYQLLENIHHPHIGKIEELITHREYTAAIIEYFPSGDLQSRIETKGRIARDKAIYYATQIAAALNTAHDHGVLHRDLKPSNVQFREDSDSLALIDFGIAKSVQKEQADHLTLEGQLIGTPHYTSPEQALGKEVDNRSDLYALGIIMYEMLEGKRPYDGRSAIEIMTGHVRGDIPDLSDPQDPLNDVIHKLMAKEPEERYASGLEVEHVLQAIRTGDTSNGL